MLIADAVTHEGRANRILADLHHTSHSDDGASPFVALDTAVFLCIDIHLFVDRGGARVIDLSGRVLFCICIQFRLRRIGFASHFQPLIDCR